MLPTNLNAAWCAVLFEELHAAGVRHAVVAPGSRSAPLALASGGQTGIRTWSVVDERSAGFFALGLARGSGAPVVVVTTSGTAGAHLLPAAIEATLTHVPLILITADRPPELHGFGASQTIDQQNLFGRYVRLFQDLGIPDARAASVDHLRACVMRAVRAAKDGAVHLNAPFREPLAPISDGTATEVFSRRAPTVALPYPEVRAPASALEAVAPWARERAKGVIVVGPHPPMDGFAEAVTRLGTHLGYPVLAEATSQLRFHATGPQVIAYQEALLRHPPLANGLRPDVILKFGGTVTSRTVQEWVDGCGARIALFHPAADVHDPNHRAAIHIQGDEIAACDSIRQLVPARTGSVYEAAWKDADARATAALRDAFASSNAITEPSTAYAVAAALRDGVELFVSSSMPIRDLDAFGGSPARTVRVHCNRGAAGIDGIPSTALGISAATGRPTVLFTGDLSFIHDLGGLLTARRYGIPLCIVVVNNDGGGIFNFLPIARFPEHFESLFGTPHGLDFAHVAALFGARLVRPTTASELISAVKESLEGGLHLVEVQVSRGANTSDHRVLWHAVAERLGGGPWG